VQLGGLVHVLPGLIYFFVLPTFFYCVASLLGPLLICFSVGFVGRMQETSERGFAFQGLKATFLDLD